MSSSSSNKKRGIQEIVVHGRETSFVALRARLRERGMHIPPLLPRVSWEPPVAHYSVDNSETGEHEAVEVAAAAKGGTPSPSPSPGLSLGRPSSGMMHAPPASAHHMPTAGYDPSAVLAEAEEEPATAQMRWEQASSLVAATRSAGAAPDASPRTSRAQQRYEELDLSPWGFSLLISFISSDTDDDADAPVELLAGLRDELGEWLKGEVTQPELLGQGTKYDREIEQQLLRFFSARLGKYPVVTADLTHLESVDVQFDDDDEAQTPPGPIDAT